MRDDSAMIDDPRSAACAPILLLFGEPDGDHVAVRVLGRNNPLADDSWYRAQLNVEVQLCVGNVRGRTQLVMLTDDFHRLRGGLDGTGRYPPALESGDSFTLRILPAASSESTLLQLQLDDIYDDAWERLPWTTEDGAWDLSFPLTSSMLLGVAATAVEISDTFPDWACCAC